MRGLTQQEIYERMKEWRNMRKLHAAARDRVRYLEGVVVQQREEITLLMQQNYQQQQTIEALQLRVEELEQKLFGRRKNKDESPAEDIPDAGKPPPVSRSPHSYQRRIPRGEDVTRTEHHSIDICPECGGELEQKTTEDFYEEDITLPTNGTSLKVVTHHTVEKGYCVRCKRWYTAMLLPSAHVILGTQVKLYICYLSILIRLSFEQVRTLLQSTYNFAVSDGEIAKILAQESHVLRPEYERLHQTIRSQRGAHYDETGWQVQAEEQGNFAWTMTGTETDDVVFAAGKSRGKGNAETLRGENTDQVGITDDYGVYRTLFEQHQLCWAHPQRKLRDLARSNMLDEKKRQHCQNTYTQFAAVYADLRLTLAEPFDIHKREAVYPGLQNRFKTIATAHPLDPKKLTTIKDSLRKNQKQYFICLWYAGIPADNNKAERVLRHVVLKRKISFGSKTQIGADAFSILASVLLSLWYRKPQNFFDAYTALRKV